MQHSKKKLISIPSLINNYIWILYNNDNQCIIIDPGEYKRVLITVKMLNLTIIAILLTHKHNDHTEGVSKLLTFFKVPVYGPIETYNKGSNFIVKEGDVINISNLKFIILSLPGHTQDHIGFYSDPWLFCGDTLFSAGCGKIHKKGEEKTMYQSLQKIKKLDENTLICSGHEYTLTNLQFSMSIMPQDENIILHENYIQKITKKKKSTLPSKLKKELKINLFLRCHETKLKHALGSSLLEEDWKTFSKLRKRKDIYNEQ